MGVTWKDGRLAAKQLFDALLAIGLDPAEQLFDNWFEHDEPRKAARRCRRALRAGYVVVGLGGRVQKALREHSVPHVSLVHPAARGVIRRKDNYIAHVRERLGAIGGAA